MEALEFSAKTVSEATRKGLEEMGLTEDQAVISVLEEKGGLFKKARVSIKKKLTDGELASEFIEKVFEKMGINAALELNETEGECEIVVSTTETSAVIGRKGEVLDALQYLASMYVNRDKEDFKRIVVDCENYREKRVENLKEIANKLADKAVEVSRKVKLDAMNPYERRIIHAELQKNDKVRTESYGEEPNRYVVIFPKNYKRPTGNGGRRDFNNRNTNRPYGDRPQGNRPYGDRPQGDRPQGDRPYGERPQGDRPQGDRPYGERPQGDRPYGDRPQGDRPYGERRNDFRGGGRDNRPRDNRDNRRNDSRPAPKKSSSFGFGTFLGNVNDGKDQNKTDKE